MIDNLVRLANNKFYYYYDNLNFAYLRRITDLQHYRNVSKNVNPNYFHYRVRSIQLLQTIHRPKFYLRQMIVFVERDELGLVSPLMVFFYALILLVTDTAWFYAEAYFETFFWGVSKVIFCRRYFHALSYLDSIMRDEMIK